MSFMVNHLSGFGSGETSPADFSGLAAWYRADAGITKGGSDLISAWADLSGNARTLSEGTGANQPTWVDAVVAGRPIVRFDGSNDLLTSTSFTLAQPAHIFMVVNQDTWTANNRLFSGNSSNSMAIVQGDSSPLVKQFNGSTFVNSVSATLDTWFLLQSYWSSTASFQRLNAAAVVSGGDGGSGGILGGFVLGNRQGADTASDVDVAELAIYSAQVTGASLDALMAYFRTRYSLY
jgi:hypothetical protein